jgi:4-amino-4-deoxy-L-arabinose transferase-like glycosyltransferase
MNLAFPEYRLFLYFITLVAIVRIVLSPFVDLGVDEAHYVLYALHLDLSYFDHPPLVGWIQYGAIYLFGNNELSARIGAILIGLIVPFFVYKLIYEVSKNASYALMAVLALHASFLFNALFIMLLPDTILFLLILPIIFTVIAIEKTNSLWMWLLLGLLLGLAGLAKYTAVLFLIPIILYIIVKNRYDLFFNPAIIPAVMIALIIISPVILWNIQNDWSSFAYQSDHVVGETQINAGAFLSSIGAQIGAYNPFLFPLAFFGLYKALSSENDTLFLTALFGLVLFFFFTFASLFKTALPHWSALFYMLFIPLGSYYLLELSTNAARVYLNFVIGFGLFISVYAYAELGFKFTPMPEYQSIHRDIYGWEEIMNKANSHIQDKQKEALAVTNWTLASRAIYYNLHNHSNVYLLDKRQDQFDLWQKDSPIGKDIIFINTHFFEKTIYEYARCEKTTKIDSFDVVLNSKKINSIELIKCSNFQGLR